MSWVTDNRHWLLFAAVVLSTLGAVGVAVVGFVWTVGVLLAGGALLQPVALLILGTLLFLGLNVVFAVALVRELAGRASLPKNRWLADRLRVVEGAVPAAAEVGLADRFEPSLDDRREELKRRYVEGELSEREFERELQALLDEREHGAETDGRIDDELAALDEAAAEEPDDDTETARQREFSTER